MEPRKFSLIHIWAPCISHNLNFSTITIQIIKNSFEENDRLLIIRPTNDTVTSSRWSLLLKAPYFSCSTASRNSSIMWKIQLKIVGKAIQFTRSRWNWESNFFNRYVILFETWHWTGTWFISLTRLFSHQIFHSCMWNGIKQFTHRPVAASNWSVAISTFSNAVGAVVDEILIYIKFKRSIRTSSLVSVWRNLARTKQHYSRPFRKIWTCTWIAGTI